MTKEEFQAMLETDEGKSLIAEMGLKTSKEVEQEKTGLNNKNRELLGKLQQAKEFKDKAKTLDELLQITELSEQEDGSNKLIDYFEKLRNPEEPDDVRELRRNFKELSEKYQAMEEDNTVTLNSVKKNLVDNVIVRKLMNEGCEEIQAQSAALYILSKAQFDLVKSDDGTRKAVNNLNQSPAEYMAEWLKSDEAARLLPAKVNSGSGVTPNSGGFTKGIDYDAEIAKAQLEGRGQDVVRLIRDKQNAQMNGIR